MYKYGSSFHLTYCALLGYPFLDALVEDRINLSGIVDDKIVPASGKIELLSRILPKFFATDYRVSLSCLVYAVYSHFICA